MYSLFQHKPKKAPRTCEVTLKKGSFKVVSIGVRG